MQLVMISLFKTFIQVESQMFFFWNSALIKLKGQSICNLCS